ncbi:predicted protein [Aspergillus terreus NIH2624]|uniref:Uncharacterized protein n=1 Tax=Aspergillus terreus (strain NIH 2624 / FGSC A1156) TaxID=341663 RepID=Q0CIA9_ASPTN|nr:uncharacterized protein ATEG_06575 [Aspergillus terreus NIH2624]EAU33119.1 predicted protein [Aspergillus terreus NIH2624]
MSDDEFYEEYDDEYFWIEEPDPTVADDLAATATYDALFFDDPSLDVEDFYSDWDELSDDYYDEDSTAARRQRVMAKWPNKRRRARRRRRAARARSRTSQPRPLHCHLHEIPPGHGPLLLPQRRLEGRRR